MLNLTVATHQEFNRDKILREYVVACEKAKRDRREQIKSALRREREERFAEGRAEGVFQAKHQILLTFLTSFYTEQFTAADRERLLQINDPQKLDIVPAFQRWEGPNSSLFSNSVRPRNA